MGTGERREKLLAMEGGRGVERKGGGEGKLTGRDSKRSLESTTARARLS